MNIDYKNMAFNESFVAVPALFIVLSFYMFLRKDDRPRIEKSNIFASIPLEKTNINFDFFNLFALNGDLLHCAAAGASSGLADREASQQ